MLAIVGGGLVGFIDDWIKVVRERNLGLNKSAKMLGLLTVALTFGLLMVNFTSIQTTLSFVRFDQPGLELGKAVWVIWAILLIVGSSNAVNLTDGLDGLATVPVILVAACFAFISYVTGNIVFSNYLQIPYIEGTGEVSIFCGAIIGSCLGFLWFNAPPAKIFMGDTGSLSLGGSLGAVGIITKHEIVLAITGGLFVLEAVSVIVQVISFKLTGKRVFKMAPIHHHFEKKGWPESTVVIRFWIISIILAMIGLATLKLR
jgi:phospho-N-acetylmuramoyl-pentapeptide-transferase